MNAPDPGVVAPTSAPANQQGRPEISSGMVCLDTSGNPRIPILMQMVAALSRSTDPKEVLREFWNGFTKLYGPRGYISLSTRGLKPGEYKITRLITDEKGSEMGEADPWRDWSKLPVHRGGLLAGVIRQAYPEIIHHLNVQSPERLVV